MDKEQAIEKLNDIRCHVKETSAEEQALVMAIEALKQPEIVRCGECAKQYKPTCPFGVWINTPDDGHCHWAERRTDG